MKYVLIGKLVNTHGLKGEVRILSSFKYKNKVFVPGMNIYIGKDKIPEKIIGYRHHKIFEMIMMEGYNDIDQVLKYKGDYVFVNKDDIIICSELSRLGRNLFMIMEILNICMTKECRVWTIKDNYRLGDDIQSKVLAFAFGLSAEIERNLISQRTKEALARKKAEGIILGRPKGRKSSPDKYKLSGKEVLISELLKNGTSLRKIAKICKVDRNTLARFIELKGLAVN